MPNIGTLLRQEITRLSRKEARGEVESTRKASTNFRKDIAELKRKVTALERQVAMLGRRALDRGAVPSPAAEGRRLRYSAKGLHSQRNRLGLSAADYGKLLGVSAQSIYNWEQGQAIPRGELLAKLASLRDIGKREVRARLAEINTHAPAK
jgi:DNA-binding XRE family transcriptional regulator